MTTTNLTGNGSFSMEYKYDAVGFALQMVQNTWDLDSEIPTTVTNFTATASPTKPLSYIRQLPSLSQMRGRDVTA
ncbi:MAG TPA: hypothetical protein VJ904_07235 [Tichowtungia sp.]|nr:hypothetical protein [Tichowtungia sp.]